MSDLGFKLEKLKRIKQRYEAQTKKLFDERNALFKNEKYSFDNIEGMIYNVSDNLTENLIMLWLQYQKYDERIKQCHDDYHKNIEAFCDFVNNMK